MVYVQYWSPSCSRSLSMWSLYVFSVDVGFLWFLTQSRDIQDRWTGDCSESEYECVWWTDHLSRGFTVYDPGKAPASWPYIGQALGKMYGIDGWMYSSYCEGSSPPSLWHSFSPPMCRSWSMFPNKIIPKPSIYQNITKKERKITKKERKKKKKTKNRTSGLAFSWNCI